MTCDSLRTGNAAAHEHANVGHATKQGDGAEDEVDRGGHPVLRAPRTACRFETGHQAGPSDAQNEQKRAPIEDPGAAISAPRGSPCRHDQIEGQKTNNEVDGVRLVECGQICGARRHAEHRYEEDVPGRAMPSRAFAEEDRQKAGQQSDRGGADMQQ
jgi:hypothetical protein